MKQSTSEKLEHGKMSIANQPSKSGIGTAKRKREKKQNGKEKEKKEKKKRKGKRKRKEKKKRKKRDSFVFDVCCSYCYQQNTWATDLPTNAQHKVRYI